MPHLDTLTITDEPEYVQVTVDALKRVGSSEGNPIMQITGHTDEGATFTARTDKNSASGYHALNVHEGDVVGIARNHRGAITHIKL